MNNIRVTVRTAEQVLGDNLTLDEAIALLDSDTNTNRSVFLPSGGHLPPTEFRMWARSMKASAARMATRAN